jgi:serine/threonine protein kinase
MSSKSQESSDVDDTVGHYVGDAGSIIGDQYEVKSQCGLGTFGKVFLAKDIKRGDTVALKIIRSIKKYINSAKIEANVLSDIFDKQEKEKVHYCVNMYSHFPFDGFYCLVFEPLGMSLFDFIKKNNYRGFDVPVAREFSIQLLSAMSFS